MSPTLLLTRPEAEARRFLAAVRAQAGDDVAAVIAPVLTIRPVAFQMPDFETAVLTSAQAVQVLGKALGGKSVVCVGAETGSAAEDSGAMVGLVAKAAEELVAKLQNHDLRRAVYFRGEHVAADLAERLGIADVVIYAQDPVALSAEAVALIGSGQRVIVPVFSRRSGQLLNSQVEKWSSDVHIITMSSAVAAVFDRPVSVLAQPTGKEMMSAVVAALKEKT